MATWQDRLNSYKTDIAAAQAEIIRAKEVYEAKKKVGDLAGAQAANTWANQIRSAVGSALDNTQYGAGVTLGQARENFSNSNVPIGTGTGNGIVGSSGNNGNLGSSGNTQPTYDVMGNIKALQKAKEDTIISGLTNSRDRALSGLQREQSTIRPMYYDKRNQVASQNQMNRRTLAEELARRGEVGSGVQDEANIRANMSLQGETGALNRQEAADVSDIERRRSDVGTSFEFDVANAKAGLEAASLEQAIAEMQRQRDMAREDARYADSRSDVEYDRTQDTTRYQDSRTDAEANRAQDSQKAQIQAFVDTINRFNANYQLEINRNKADGDASNDWQIPYLEAARANKIAQTEANKSQSAQDSYKNALNIWETTGIATPEIASILGVPVGAKTADYNLESARVNISQQNANTNAKNASKSKAEEKPTKSEQTNADFASDYSSLKAMSVKNAVKAMNDNWGSMLSRYGADGAVKLWNTVLADAIKMGQAEKR
jgi:hypothetical protein